MTVPVLEVHLTDDDASAALRSDVRAGLRAEPKWLSPKWFYDARGSELFERITELPEYYPFRAEREVLAAYAADIARAAADTLVELGSGPSEKTRLLLDAMDEAGTLRRYVPLDVSEPALREAAAAILADYPGLEVRGVVGDFTRHLDLLPAGGRRMVAFLGGTIGNLLPPERAEFLAAVADALEPGERLLVGADLVKDASTLVRAYDDAAGVTAEFNRNVLRVLNRELGADFDPAAFSHVAVWDADAEWIEMRLRAQRAMTVRLPVVDLVVEFAAGDELRTEVSAKFRRAGLESELSAAGFRLDEWWTDTGERFAVCLATARAPARG